jgi:hypothetical protein
MNKKTLRKYAKLATTRKCRLKTCKAKKYQSIYGLSRGGNIRSPNFLGF